ncbi:MAG: SpoIIE family protein phosphatase [Acidobacteriota bacterium]
MEIMTNADIREELQNRRKRLEAVVSSVPLSTHLAELMEEVDAALERMNSGTYGLCEECHDPIERDRLVADPLTRFCIDHLSARERTALQEDLDLASRVQNALLPKQITVYSGWEIAHAYFAAGPVSGDYCDVVIPEDEAGHLFLAIGDVSGKGVAASMLMAHLNATFRSLARIGLPVGNLIQRANRLFCESIMPGHYATLVCGRAEASGEIELCNAGHPPPLLAHGGDVTRVEEAGLPLGMFCSGYYNSSKVILTPGDTLLLYTDGLTEARNRSSEEYGIDRLYWALLDNPDAEPQALIERLIAELREFQAGAPQVDDMTIMVVRRSGVVD